MGVHVVDVTCSHCGRQRHFDGDGITPRQLALIASQRCKHCEGLGAAVVLTSYEGNPPFKLERLATTE